MKKFFNSILYKVNFHIKPSNLVHLQGHGNHWYAVIDGLNGTVAASLVDEQNSVWVSQEGPNRNILYPQKIKKNTSFNLIPERDASAQYHIFGDLNRGQCRFLNQGLEYDPLPQL